MNDLLLHPKTADRIQTVLHRTPHGLLITGEAGSGKKTVAGHLAARILQIPLEKLEAHPYSIVINPDGSVIKIEAIRELQQFLKLKVPSNAKGIHRVVIVERAERMRSEAQNALLKTLEEPPVDTVIILTAESSERLLKTIVSRCQELPILPVSQTQAQNYFSSHGISDAKFKPAYALSMGQAGLLYALLHDENHPLKEQVAVAKEILAESAGRRLTRVDALSKDKNTIRLLLNALKRITHAGLHAAGTQNKSAALSQWHAREEKVLQAHEDLERNANTKLLLTDLFLRV